ncbi:biotin transporter BioY [Staphylococcus chromogenes]|nr:biotin transporter BioY [Staphylococcus chromogenes]
MASSSAKTLRDVAFIAVFAALIIAFAFVSIPTGSGVPIVMQNAVIILAGLVLGGKRGFFAAGLFLLLGMLGLPVLAGGRNVLSALAGPSVGYLVGYVVSPALAGFVAYLAPRGKAGMTLTFAIAGIVGLLTQYTCGIIGLIARVHLDFKAALLAQVPFLGPDAAKVAVMVVVAIAVHAAFPDLMARSRR